MKCTWFWLRVLVCGVVAIATFSVAAKTATWQKIEAQGDFSERHEAGFVALGNKGYLLGGRGIKPVNVFDPKTKTWAALAKTPLEFHHFQPVVWQQKIVVAGAMTGGYPKETPVANLYYFDPAENVWEKGPEIPQERRRGGAIAVVVDGVLYLIGGIVNGHLDGNVSWVDAFDFTTKTWTVLPDAPRARDHAQGVVIDGKIYALGGRRTLGAQDKVFELVEAKVDVFDLSDSSWKTLKSELRTPRAGIAAFTDGKSLIVVGGESADPSRAHDEVDRYTPATARWSRVTPLKQGRHGSGVIELDGHLWIASGSGMQGGSPELTNLEFIEIDKIFTD